MVRSLIAWFVVACILVAAMVLLMECAAAAPLEQPAADGPDLVPQLVDTGLSVFETLSSILTALTVFVGARLAGWLRAKAGNERLGNALARLTDTVFTIVREAEQTIVKQLRMRRAPDSPGGDKITKEEAEYVKREVVARVKAVLGERALDEVRRGLGIDAKGLEEIIGAKVESACLGLTRNP